MLSHDHAAFEPEATTILTKAINDACDALHIPAEARQDREVVAARIADLARSGVLDAKALCARVLQEARLDAS